MERCLFDCLGRQCEIMQVSSKEKGNFCHVCKSKCVSEHDLVVRYATVIVRSTDITKRKFTLELNKYAGRRVKLMQLGVSKECIKSIIKENNHSLPTLANITDIPVPYLKLYMDGEPISKLSAKVLAEELGYKVEELFDPLKMS